MSQLVEKSVSEQAASVATVTSEEVVIATSPKVVVPMHTARILVKFWLAFASGANATVAAARIRRGATIAGTQLRLFTNSLTADQDAIALTMEGSFTETVANVDTVQYTLTMAFTNATGAGTIDGGIIEVDVLNG